MNWKKLILSIGLSISLILGVMGFLVVLSVLGEASQYLFGRNGVLVVPALLLVSMFTLMIYKVMDN